MTQDKRESVFPQRNNFGKVHKDLPIYKFRYSCYGTQ